MTSRVRSSRAPGPGAFPPGWDQATGGLSRFTWPRGSLLSPGPLPGAAGCAGLHARVIAAERGLDPLAEAAKEVVTAMTASAVTINADLPQAPAVLPWLRAGARRLPAGTWDASPEPPALLDLPDLPDLVCVV